MGSYLKIDPIRLGKFNNAEYTNFMNRTLNQALAAGVEKIAASETSQYLPLIFRITTSF